MDQQTGPGGARFGWAAAKDLSLRRGGDTGQAPLVRQLGPRLGAFW